MVLILGAIYKEIAYMVDSLEDSSIVKFGMRTYHIGKLAGHDVAIGNTGVGKVQSSIVSQMAISYFKPDYYIFIGTAGALNPDLKIGDFVVCDECVQYDMDCSDLGLPAGRTPYCPENMQILHSDPVLLECALDFVPPDGSRSIRGRVLTGDSVVGNIGGKEKLVAAFSGDVVEMEGYAASFCAAMNKIPFLLIRVVSDQADGNVKIDYVKFLDCASEKLDSIVVHILNNNPAF
ncbi:MAG: 5'-methylthioadenosine/adenosylhomocysteine nucleosidase [Spirochaetia bacterium]|nr:5'-methylthioadenosine/adenosylhomocysteine nucleosidase [Spirochaetia bacterium]